jgi:hypothetical protein
MCPPLAQLIIGFFSFLFNAAVYSTNEANKVGLKQSRFKDVYAAITTSVLTCHGYLGTRCHKWIVYICLAQAKVTKASKVTVKGKGIQKTFSV